MDPGTWGAKVPIYGTCYCVHSTLYCGETWSIGTYPNVTSLGSQVPLYLPCPFHAARRRAKPWVPWACTYHMSRYPPPGQHQNRSDSTAPLAALANDCPQNTTTAVYTYICPRAPNAHSPRKPYSCPPYHLGDLPGILCVRHRLVIYQFPSHTLPPAPNIVTTTLAASHTLVAISEHSTETGQPGKLRDHKAKTTFLTWFLLPSPLRTTLSRS